MNKEYQVARAGSIADAVTAGIGVFYRTPEPFSFDAAVEKTAEEAWESSYDAGFKAGYEMGLTVDGGECIISEDGTDDGEVYTYLSALVDENFTIEVIESAKVLLPDEIGSIVRYKRRFADRERSAAAIRTGVNGWMRTDNDRYYYYFFSDEDIQELPDLEVVFVPGK